MSDLPLNRRTFLTATGSALVASVASQSATAQPASGPTVYIGTAEASVDSGWMLHAVDAATGEQAWAFTEPSDPIFSSPTVVDGTVYVGSQDETLYAVDAAEGTQNWAFTEPSDAVFSSPTVIDGTVYVGSNDETLYAVDAAEGTQEWAFTEPSGEVDSSPTVWDGTVYVGSSDGTLYAVDAAEGAQEWAFTEPFGPVQSSPTVVDETVYVGLSDGRLYAVDAATGEQEWTFTEPSSPVFSSPTVMDGTIYIESTGTSDNDWEDVALYAVDAATGEQEWTFTELSGEVLSSPTVWDGNVYVGSGDETLYAVDAATGEQEWAFTELSGPVFPSPTVWDKTVYVGSIGGLVHAVDAETGEREWRFETDAVGSSPTVVEDPENGSSIGSRMRLETLGHHNGFESGAGSDLIGPTEIVAVGGVGGVATLIGAYLFQQRGTDTDEQPLSASPENPTPKSESHTEATPSHADESDDHGSGMTDEALNSTQTLRERIGSARPPGHSGGPPETIPRTPEFALTYDDIKPSDSDAIGQGGNADVYRTTVSGQQGELPVAVKKPRMGGTLHTGAVEQILEEAEIWQKLDDHDHIVSVIGYGSEPLPWIAMEYMDGGHLRDQAGDLGINQALWTAIATTEAVRHAHRRGVAHLDLKPENILFRSVEDAWNVPKVADWGLSKHLLEHSNSVEALSPQYAAPEQFDDSYGDTDDLTDVYQLGAVFYELFTGRPPFEGKPAMVMNKVLNERPPSPSVVADVPSELDDMLQPALAKRKDDRYESVLYLRDELQGLF